MLPVALFLLGLVGLGVHTEQPEVELRVGAHRTHATETMTRATTGVAVIAPLHRFFAIQAGAAYSQRGSLTCWGWWGETAAEAVSARYGNARAASTQDTPCLPASPDLTLFDDRTEYSLLGRMTVPTTGDRLRVHLLLGPTLSVPYGCQLEHRDSGERRGCSPDGLDTDLVLTLGAELGLRLTERLDFTLGARYGSNAINYYRTTGGGKQPESSLLAGVVYRPK